jgi:AraC-like DNA-binding protein
MPPASPSWDFPRNPSAALSIVQVAEQRGVPVRAALSSTGLTRADLTRPDLEIAAGQELTVIRNVLRRLGASPGLGTEVGTRLTVGMLGVWGFAMLNSRTLRDAIDVGNRYGYGNLSFLFIRPRVQYRRHDVCLVHDGEEVPDDVRDFIIERDLAAQASLIPRLAGKAIRFRVETTLGPVGGTDLAAALYPHPVEHSSSRNAISIPRTALDAPLPQADQHAVRMWKRRCEQLIEHHQRPTRGAALASQVRAALQREPGLIPSLEDLSAGFNVTSRTLRRQLTAEGVSYRELVDDVRSTQALELLADGQSVADVAHQTGFADSASFIRAFKRWTGQTPGNLASSPDLDE